MRRDAQIRVPEYRLAFYLEQSKVAEACAKMRSALAMRIVRLARKPKGIKQLRGLAQMGEAAAIS